jgi:hypothetical protein
MVPTVDVDRREFLTLGAIGAIGATSARLGGGGAPGGSEGPYGPLLPPDANGLLLPDGFTSRELARSTHPVPGLEHIWHTFPDGGATFRAGKNGRDGWIYVSNSEFPTPGQGGVGALRFDRAGAVVDAYPILTGTQTNCAGGPTPWGTWLSCEEHDTGQVWECDPTGEAPGEVRPALGVFKHEAVAVDPRRERLYLTEDEEDGRLYRFTPARYPNLDAGTLEVASVDDRDAVSWLEVPDPSAASTPTREQVPESTAFDGGEGIWYRAGIVYFATKGDRRVWSYDVRRSRLTTLHDAAETPGTPVSSVDNLALMPNGDVLVAEDQESEAELVLITPEGAASPLLRVDSSHDGSELCGPAFSPDGTRLYFSSERGAGGPGVTYEVTGPFERARRPVQKPPATAGALAGVTPGAALALTAAAVVWRLRAGAQSDS